MAAEAVKVIVRCRPQNDREKNLKCDTIITMDSKRAQVSIVNSVDKKAPPKFFTFDGAYFVDSTTEQIYNEIGYPLVEGVTEGYNGTIFAYGQTGCGKSFSMQGITDPATQRGIIPRAFDHIFETISVAESTKFLVHASYLEIYNEDVRDLLGKDTKARLELKEHPEKGIYVQGLSQHPVHNVRECESIMNRGWKNRATGATLMNADSSRSHSIFTIYMEMAQKDENGEEHIRAGKLNLVDLAGSERQSKTASTGDRLKEATKINLSLSALGNVISALVDGKSKHIPYRDAKLTRLLQDSLGGNTKTLMVACISPADNNYEESLSTLRYANRAKNIKNKPKINEDPKDALLREYQEEIERLKAMLMGQMPVSVDAVTPQRDSPASKTSQDITREMLEDERKNLKEEYDLKLHEIEQRYEEEKTGKVRLEQDISRLREFYDDKLKNVDGRLAHLPSTAAILGEIEWEGDEKASASEENKKVGSKKDPKTIECEHGQKPADGSISENQLDTITEANDSGVTGEVSREDARHFDDKPPDIDQALEGPDTAIIINNAKVETAQAQFEEATSEMAPVESVGQNNAALVGPLIPDVKLQPGWFDTKNLPVEHQELLQSDPEAALADMQKDIMDRLKELQMQMVGGENVDNEEVKERHQERIKFAEKRKAQLAEAIAGMDDDGIMLTIYDNIQDELRHKNELLEYERNKVKSMECEITDVQSEFEFDRIDYLDTIRKQTKQLRLMEAIIEKIQPCVRKDCNYGNLDKVKKEAAWDEDAQVWTLPKLVVERTSLPNPNGSITNGHDDPRRTDDDARRQKLMDRDRPEYDTYFQSRRLSKYTSPGGSNEVRLAKSELHQDIPYTNGHTSLDNPVENEMRAAHVHGQTISTEEPGMRRPARLESLPLPGGKRNKKKQRNGHLT